MRKLTRLPLKNNCRANNQPGITIWLIVSKRRACETSEVKLGQLFLVKIKEKINKTNKQTNKQTNKTDTQGPRCYLLHVLPNIMIEMSECET